MKLAHMKAGQLKQLLAKGETTNREIMISVLDEIDLHESEVQAYITIRNRSELLLEADAIDSKRLKGEPVGVLDGLPTAVKDNICTKGLLTTCASKILSNFIPPYDATVVTRIKKADGIIIGKTNMDEFAMGSSTENSSIKVTRNPNNLNYVPGGSSGGSAAAIAANEAIFAIGSDTGGSIRQPASYCGVVGMKPTYGRVSRYGLIAYGSSLDQIGVLTKDIKDASLLMGVIAGYDSKDSTSLNKDVNDYSANMKECKSLRIGVPEEYFSVGLDEEVKSIVQNAISVLEKNGHEIIPIRLPHSEYGVAAYYIIVCSEASSNLARYSGIHYGFRSEECNNINDVFFKSRNQGFGPEVQRRIMLGTYALSSGYYDAYYIKASKVRTLLKQDFENAYKKCDIIAHPVAPGPAFKIDEKLEDPLTMYLVDVYSVIANLVGIPAVSIPCGKTGLGLPVGIQLSGNHLQELNILKAAYTLENLLDNSL